VTELRYVMRASGRGYFGDERRQLIGWEMEVMIGEAGKRGAGMEDLERVGVVDEQANRQLSVELLQQEQVDGTRMRACPPSWHAVRTSRRTVQG
jgi:hypothetical protein